jgi:Leucine-rich repeat (LRR) protein
MPPAIGGLTSLNMLALEDNKLSDLPPEIGYTRPSLSREREFFIDNLLIRVHHID